MLNMFMEVFKRDKLDQITVNKYVDEASKISKSMREGPKNTLAKRAGKSEGKLLDLPKYLSKFRKGTN